MSSAGRARTSTFLLNSATVMLGTTDEVWDLRPEAHSVGLVKDFQITAEPTYVELMQGLKPKPIYTVLTGHGLRASMNVFEHTAKNFIYALGLDGGAAKPFDTSYVTNGNMVGSDTGPVTTVVLLTNNTVAAMADFKAGDWVAIQRDPRTDQVHYAKLSEDSTQVTLNVSFRIRFASHGLRQGNDFPLGSIVRRVTLVEAAAVRGDSYLSARVTSILPATGQPISLVFPKVKVRRGFSLAFATDNFGGMPFEFTPMTLLPSDTHYPLIGSQTPVFLYNLASSDVPYTFDNMATRMDQNDITADRDLVLA